MKNITKTQNQKQMDLQTFQKENEEIVFFSAEEMLKKTSENWSYKTDKEIFKKIQEKASQGKREAYFLNAKILESTVRELEQLGYSIKVSNYNGCPMFEIKW